MGIAAPTPVGIGAIAAAIAGLVVWLMKRLNTPSRVYDREANSVGREYDAWTTEGILEYYWGEHIHLGYYGENERKAPFYGGKNFIEAKYDFIDKMLEFSRVELPQKVLDVGCGIGGTSRYIAKKFPKAEVTGITISPEQRNRATELAKERGISNAKFELCDALNMTCASMSVPDPSLCQSDQRLRLAMAVQVPRQLVRLRVGMRVGRAHARQGEVRAGDDASA